jgi:hypothetical protein
MWSAHLPAQQLAGEHIRGWRLPGRLGAIGHSPCRRLLADADCSRFDTSAASGA